MAVSEQPRCRSQAICVGGGLEFNDSLTPVSKLILRECTERKRACGFYSLRNDVLNELLIGREHSCDYLCNFKSAGCIPNGRRNLNSWSGEAFPSRREQLSTVDRVWTDIQARPVRPVSSKAVPATRRKHSEAIFGLVIGKALRYLCGYWHRFVRCIRCFYSSYLAV